MAWRTVSAEDGDPAKGYFSFVVGAQAPAAGRGTTQSATQTDVTASLGIAPLVAGENGYSVALSTGGGSLQNVSRVRLRITPQDRDIGQSEIVLQTGGTGFTARGFELPFAGRYRVQVQVQVRRSDGVNDLTFDFDVVAAAPSVLSPSPAATIASAAPATTAPATTAPAAPAAADGPMVSPGALGLGVVLTLLAAVTAIILLRRRA